VTVSQIHNGYLVQHWHGYASNVAPVAFKMNWVP